MAETNAGGAAALSVAAERGHVGAVAGPLPPDGVGHWGSAYAVPRCAAAFGSSSNFLPKKGLKC